MKDIYEEIDAAGLPPILKQIELLDRTFLITDLSERFEGLGSEDREARAYYIATVFTGEGEARHYLAGTAVLDKLAVLDRRRQDLPVAFALIKKRTRNGHMYDLVRPDAAAGKELLRDYHKLHLVEAAS